MAPYNSPVIKHRCLQCLKKHKEYYDLYRFMYNVHRHIFNKQYTFISYIYSSKVHGGQVYPTHAEKQFSYTENRIQAFVTKFLE